MLDTISSALDAVLTWLSIGFWNLIQPDGALYSLWPLLAVGIAISVVMLVVKVVKRFAWGA